MRWYWQAGQCGLHSPPPHPPPPHPLLVLFNMSPSPTLHPDALVGLPPSPFSSATSFLLTSPILLSTMCFCRRPSCCSVLLCAAVQSSSLFHFHCCYFYHSPPFPPSIQLYSSLFLSLSLCRHLLLACCYLITTILLHGEYTRHLPMHWCTAAAVHPHTAADVSG